MTSLTDAFNAAQSFKEQYTVDVNHDEFWRVRRRLIAEGILDPSLQTIWATIAGAGWIGQMAEKWCLDVPEFMKVQAHLAELVMRQSPKEVSREAAIQIGLGAGFATGVLVGLLIAEAREGVL